MIPFIDGFNHIARIAYQSDVETNLVKACIQNLVYYGVVSNYIYKIFDEEEEIFLINIVQISLNIQSHESTVFCRYFLFKYVFKI